MATSPNRALRIVLGIFSLLAAVGGLLMIFSGKPLMTRLFLHPVYLKNLREGGIEGDCLVRWQDQSSLWIPIKDFHEGITGTLRSVGRLGC
jgi:hypothetical protein